jgi:site-specific DNA recombinase
VARQLARLRSGIGRLIDSYAEGVIGKAEFEPRLAGLRQRVARLEAEAAALQDAAEQARSLQLVVGRLETFAALIRGQLDGADWNARRDIIRTLVRRVEVDDEHVRVVFRVDPGPQGGAGSRRIPQHCPGRRRAVAVRHAGRHPRGSRAEASRLRHDIGQGRVPARLA